MNESLVRNMSIDELVHEAGNGDDPVARRLADHIDALESALGLAHTHVEGLSEEVSDLRRNFEQAHDRIIETATKDRNWQDAANVIIEHLGDLEALESAAANHEKEMDNEDPRN